MKKHGRKLEWRSEGCSKAFKDYLMKNKENKKRKRKEGGMKKKMGKKAPEESGDHSKCQIWGAVTNKKRQENTFKDPLGPENTQWPG